MSNRNDFIYFKSQEIRTERRDRVNLALSYWWGKENQNDGGFYHVMERPSQEPGLSPSEASFSGAFICLFQSLLLFSWDRDAHKSGATKPWTAACALGWCRHSSTWGNAHVQVRPDPDPVAGSRTLSGKFPMSRLKWKLHFTAWWIPQNALHLLSSLFKRFQH